MARGTLHSISLTQLIKAFDLCFSSRESRRKQPLNRKAPHRSFVSQNLANMQMKKNFRRRLVFAGGICVMIMLLAKPAPKATIMFVSWDKSTRPVFSNDICDKRLTVSKPPTTIIPQFSSLAIDVFRTKLRSNEIEGWMGETHIKLSKFLTEIQHKRGVFGSVGEIGVHMGKYFACNALNSATGEQLVAADLFPETANNTVDGSGWAQRNKFISNMESLGIKNITIMSGDSSLLTSASFAKHHVDAFRFFSVDGGHTLDLTLHDLNVAACVVAPGGIVALDDVFNFSWPGVLQAVSLFVQFQKELIPFLYFGNKLFFTTPDYYAEYLDEVQTRVNCRKKIWHLSRRSLGPYDVCWSTSHDL